MCQSYVLPSRATDDLIMQLYGSVTSPNRLCPNLKIFIGVVPYFIQPQKKGKKEKIL